jgi:hypothetical protein
MRPRTMEALCSVRSGFGMRRERCDDCVWCDVYRSCLDAIVVMSKAGR